MITQEELDAKKKLFLGGIIMAKQLKGKAICDRDGEFSWHGYAFEGTDVVIGEISKIRQNFECATKMGDSYKVQVCCPICKRISVLFVPVS